METLKAIANRKTVRGYKPDQITDKDLEVILNSGCAAPVGMKDYDSLHMSVIQNRELLDKINDIVSKGYNNPDMKTFYNAPTAVILSAKKNEKALGIENANVGCVLENMAIVATDLGLGSAYIMSFLGVLKDGHEIFKEIGIPEGYSINAALLLGYPANENTDCKTLSQTITMNIVK